MDNFHQNKKLTTVQKKKEHYLQRFQMVETLYHLKN